jgi:hypothetical protein
MSGPSSRAATIAQPCRRPVATVTTRPGTHAPLPLGSSAGLRVGDTVLAAWSHLGLSGAVTAGILSAVDRATGGRGGATLQTDAPINAGNSGSPGRRRRPRGRRQHLHRLARRGQHQDRLRHPPDSADAQHIVGRRDGTLVRAEYRHTVAEHGPGIDLVDAFLRPLGLWVGGHRRVRPLLFETHVPADTRPRDAIEGIREFARGGRRTGKLRTLSWAANTASRDVVDPVAKAAARAASLAAASAYMHLDVPSTHQIKHALGPAVYVALARELAADGDRLAGDAEIAWAIGHATPAVRQLVRRTPAPSRRRRTRLNVLFVELDAGLRA